MVAKMEIGCNNSSPVEESENELSEFVEAYILTL